ncbi:MAG: hypothetical protein QXU47_09280 [Candidatus Bathyarchaeia archaeon]
MDGFNPRLGWIRVDLTELFHIHRVYELKRRRLQEKASKKPSLRRVLTKYSGRERNRARDFIHKLTTFLSREYEGYIHGFEILEKKRMFNSSKRHIGRLRRATGRLYSPYSIQVEDNDSQPEEYKQKMLQMWDDQCPEGSKIRMQGMRVEDR